MNWKYGPNRKVLFQLFAQRNENETRLQRNRRWKCLSWRNEMTPAKPVRISLGLMINAGMLLASSRKLIFGGPMIARGLTGKSLSAVKWELMKPTRRPSVILVTETGLFLWMSSPVISGGPLLTLGVRLEFVIASPLFVRVVDWCVCLLVRLICCQIILTASSPGRLLICRSLAIHLLVLPSLPSGRERSQRLLLDLDLYGGTDPLGMFPLFLKRTADAMPPRLSEVFRRLLRLFSFPPCWRQANVTPIPKDPPPSLVANYRPISIASVLSKVFERLVYSS